MKRCRLNHFGSWRHYVGRAGGPVLGLGEPSWRRQVVESSGWFEPPSSKTQPSRLTQNAPIPETHMQPPRPPQQSHNDPNIAPIPHGNMNAHPTRSFPRPHTSTPARLRTCIRGKPGQLHTCPRAHVQHMDFDARQGCVLTTNSVLNCACFFLKGFCFA